MTMNAQRLTIVAAIVALAACSDAAGPAGEQDLQVSVRVTNGTSSASAGLVGSPQAPAATTVEIQSVAFVLGGLKLETAGLDSTVDWVFEESVVIPLDLAGDPVLAFDTDVPSGTYKEFELSVDKLEVGNPAEEPLIAEWPDLADASVVVTGTVTTDGGTPQPFTFTAALDIDLELLFDNPVTFTADDNPVTLVSLMIDLSGWFQGTGDMLDPTDPANRSEIEGNIQASVELHEGN
jgi:hypothetical protein